jgi:hypothetical protein
MASEKFLVWLCRVISRDHVVNINAMYDELGLHQI